MICFFAFLSCAILLERGQITSYFQELGIEARSRFSRYLAIRENMIQELSTYLERSSTELQFVVSSHESSTRDILLSLQHIAKKSSESDITSQIKYRLDEAVAHCATQSLSTEIRT
jgi:hypothetical protein